MLWARERMRKRSWWARLIPKMPRRVAYAYLFLPLSLKLKGLSPCSHLINPLSFGVQVVNYHYIYARPITPDFFSCTGRDRPRSLRGKKVWPMTLTLRPLQLVYLYNLIFLVRLSSYASGWVCSSYWPKWFVMDSMKNLEASPFFRYYLGICW